MEPVIDCPVCGEATTHRLLKATDNTLTAQCIDCGDVVSMSPPRSRSIELRLIVSHDAQARSDRIEVDPDEPIGVGDEFDHNGHRMIVTGLEMAEGKAKRAKAQDIHVLHAKVFDSVALKVSVNEHDVTRSYRIDVTPEASFQIGEVILVEGRKLTIKTLKSDENRTLHRGGLPARHIVRVFCDPAPPGARVGDVVTARPRGKPVGKGTPAKRGPSKGPRGKPVGKTTPAKRGPKKATPRKPVRKGPSQRAPRKGPGPR